MVPCGPMEASAKLVNRVYGVRPVVRRAGSRAPSRLGRAYIPAWVGHTKRKKWRSRRRQLFTSLD